VNFLKNFFIEFELSISFCIRIPPPTIIIPFSTCFEDFEAEHDPKRLEKMENPLFINTA
jgi:hypothetical protein